MKTLTLLLCLLMACVSQAGDNEGFTLWGTTSDNADNLLMGRIGYELPQRFEIGATSKWTTSSTEWGPTPDFYGIYGLYHIDEVLGFTDDEPNDEWEELLHNLVGRPYFGLEGLYSSDTKKVRPNFIVGTLFTAKSDEARKIGFVLEYVSGAMGKDIFHLGMRIKF
jgi:hypothetical protein